MQTSAFLCFVVYLDYGIQLHIYGATRDLIRFLELLQILQNLLPVHKSDFVSPNLFYFLPITSTLFVTDYSHFQYASSSFYMNHCIRVDILLSFHLLAFAVSFHLLVELPMIVDCVFLQAIVVQYYGSQCVFLGF